MLEFFFENRKKKSKISFSSDLKKIEYVSGDFKKKNKALVTIEDMQTPPPQKWSKLYGRCVSAE